MPATKYLNNIALQVPSVTQINGLGPEKRGMIIAANKEGLAGRNIRDVWYGEAARAGDIAHILIAAIIKRREINLNDFPTDGARDMGVKAFETYKRWNETINIDWVDSELSLVSEKHQFGGTIDAIGIPRGSNTYCIGDWKSGALYNEQLIQVSAYWHLFEEVTGHTINGAHLVRFNKLTGDFIHAYFDDLEPEWETFLAKRTLWDKLKACPPRLK